MNKLAELEAIAKTNREKISCCLSTEHFDRLEKMVSRGHINVDADLWSKIVYDCIETFHHYERKAIKTLLTPDYLY